MYSTTLDESIAVNRPVADCYRYLLDFSTIEQWDPGVSRARKLTPGQVRVGTEFEVALAGLSRGVVMRYRLKESLPGQSLLLEGEGGDVRALDRIEFQAIGPRETRIRYRAELYLSRIPRHAGALMQPLLDRIGKAAVAGLRLALEGGHAEAPQESPSPSLAQRLVLPAALSFTKAGYRSMPEKGLSRFLDGKVVALTGPTSGIGLAAACELARLGARLILIGRGKTRLRAAAQTVADFAGSDVPAITIDADLSCAADVDRAADAVADAAPRLDVLINNAGALFDQRLESADGLEMTLAINLMAPFRLTRHLVPELTAGHGRVINVASGGQYLQGLELDDLQSSRGRFDGVKAYARMKRGLVSLTRRWAAEHPVVAFHSMHPGWVATPGVSRSLPRFDRVTRRVLREPRMGADTIVWLASAEPSMLGSGLFWLDRKPQPEDVLASTAVSASQAERLEQCLACLASMH